MKNKKITSWYVWQCCGGFKNIKEQNIFWSDIILHIKNNPDKSAYFEDIFLKLDIKENFKDIFNTPLPVLVKLIMKEKDFFNEATWSLILNHWAEINIQLKIQAQTIILKQGSLVDSLVYALQTQKNNPRILMQKLAHESGLFKRYSRNNVIMMLCFSIAENLEKKENGVLLVDEGVFQMADDVQDNENNKVEKDNASVLVPGTILTGSIDEVTLDKAWKSFIIKLNDTSVLDAIWEETDKYLDETLKIIAYKKNERKAALKRMTLIEDFESKKNYLYDTFYFEMTNLGLNISFPDNIDVISNEKIEKYTDLLSELKIAFKNYRAFNSDQKKTITEEKKRVGELFTVINNIETLVNSIAFIEDTTSTNQIEQSIDNDNNDDKQVDKDIQKLSDKKDRVVSKESNTKKVKIVSDFIEDKNQIKLFSGTD